MLPATEGEPQFRRLSRRKLLYILGLGTAEALMLSQKRSTFSPVIEHSAPDSYSRLSISSDGLRTGSFDYDLNLAGGYFVKHHGDFYDEFTVGRLRFQVSLTAGTKLNLKVSMAAGQTNQKRPESAFMSAVQDEKPVADKVIESRWRNWKPEKMMVTATDLLKRLHPIHTWLR